MRTILLLFLTLTAFGCGYSRPKQMTQSGIVPVVAAIMPASQMHGGSDFMLTVTGSNFNGNGSSTPGGPYGGGSNTPSETSNSMTFTIN